MFGCKQDEAADGGGVAAKEEVKKPYVLEQDQEYREMINRSVFTIVPSHYVCRDMQSVRCKHSLSTEV